MPNPFVGGRLNTSRRQDTERPTPIAPVPEDYAGDNLPYRGTEQHGVSVAEHWRDTSEDMSLRPDGRLVDVYEPEETAHEPIPVYIVNQSSHERRAFKVINAYATGTNNGTTGRMILPRDDGRTQATIRNPGGGQHINISNSADLCNSTFGFTVLTGSTYVTQTQEALYAACPTSADDYMVQIAVEYRKSLDG